MGPLGGPQYPISPKIHSLSMIKFRQITGMSLFVFIIDVYFLYIIFYLTNYHKED